MRNGRWLLIGLGSCCSLACAGGQSGTETSPPICTNIHNDEIGVDDSTLLGTARQRFTDAVTFPRQPASMRWNSPTDGSTFDTFVTLSVSGMPTHAVFSGDPAPSCSGLWSLSIDGAILNFQSADGAFNESVSGTLSVGQYLQQFRGYPDTPFVGTYDIDSATKRFAHPTVVLETSTGLGSGWLWVSGTGDPQIFYVATWLTRPGSAGAGGTASTNDGGAFGDGGTDAGESGNGGNGGATGAVATAGAGAGGAATDAGSGGSN